MDGTADSLRQIVGYNLKRADSAMLARLKEVLDPFGLRPVTFSVLKVLRDHPGLRQADLSDLLAVDRPNTVSLVAELTARGLVSRKRDPNDGRAYALALTKAGAALCETSGAAVQAFDLAITQGFGPAERDTLCRLLNRIETNATAWRKPDDV